MWKIRLFLRSLIRLLAFFSSGICFYFQIFLFIYFSLTSDCNKVLPFLQTIIELQKNMLVTGKIIEYLHFRSEYLSLLPYPELLHGDNYGWLDEELLVFSLYNWTLATTSMFLLHFLSLSWFLIRFLFLHLIFFHWKVKVCFILVQDIRGYF